MANIEADLLLPPRVPALAFRGLMARLLAGLLVFGIATSILPGLLGGLFYLAVIVLGVQSIVVHMRRGASWVAQR